MTDVSRYTEANDGGASNWICPNCNAKHDDDSRREECWECGIEACELCVSHTDIGIACDACANEGDSHA